MLRTFLNTLFYTVLTVFILSSCTYTSEYPIEENGIPIKQELLGKWVDANVGGTTKPNYILFDKQSDTKYKMQRFTWNEADSSYASPMEYNTHLTNLKGTLFLNAENGGSYTFYKLEMSGKQIKIFGVTSNIDEEFTSSEALKAFFLENKDRSFFYNQGEEVYTKEDVVQ